MPAMSCSSATGWTITSKRHFGSTVSQQLEQRRCNRKAISRFPTWRACIIDRLMLFTAPIIPFALLALAVYLWDLHPIYKYLMAGAFIMFAIFALRWVQRVRPDQWVPVASRDALTA
jgi:hypothetical protein